MSKRFAEFVVPFVFIFLLAVYVIGSIPWSILIAILPTWPLFVLWVLCDMKHYERCKKVPREPYIIGDSKEIEYLTEEELEQRLKHGKTGES